ncbi:MAG: helix-turn-helix domain-containing protein [Lachnospiraceae bacterium]
MDQVKIGNFLKKLRKEKGITQEQLAEILNVSGRTVSRWETGNNMPDISILVDIADYYDISIPEDYQWRKEKRDDERRRKKNC